MPFDVFAAFTVCGIDWPAPGVRPRRAAGERENERASPRVASRPGKGVVDKVKLGIET